MSIEDGKPQMKSLSEPTVLSEATNIPKKNNKHELLAEYQVLIDQIEQLERLLEKKLSEKQREYVKRMIEGIINDETITDVAKNIGVSGQRLRVVWHTFKARINRSASGIRIRPYDDYREYAHGRLDFKKRTAENRKLIEKLEAIFAEYKKRMNLNSEEEIEEMRMLEIVLNPLYSLRVAQSRNSEKTKEIILRLKKKHDIDLPNTDDSWHYDLEEYLSEKK